ncbi:50S ribosomal protein L32 [Patescibacteria group bacterium]|nr:50S ribosomal protein L32 [Patescibacteria group bacterium]
MAAQPKKKISRVRGRTRRAHSAVKLLGLVLCTNCQQPKPAHIACPHCGFYGQRKVLTTKTDKRIATRLKRDQAAAARKARSEKKKKATPQKKSAPKKSSSKKISEKRAKKDSDKK